MAAENDVVPLSPETNRKWRFDLVGPLYLRPRATLTALANQNRANWRTPVVLLILAAVVRALVAGSVKRSAAAGGVIDLPPGFEYYTPEQMAQFEQAATATNTPAFNYVLPAIGAVLGVLAVWFIISWLLHLVLTLLGGRGTSQATINITAWAGLPFILLYAIQIIAMMVTNRLIVSPGLAGFAPAGEAFTNRFLSALLSQIDIYWIWSLILLVIGAGIVSKLSSKKVWFAVLLVTGLVMVLRALPGAILARFSDLTVIQPFF